MRRALEEGHGRPVKQCRRMDPYLIKPSAGYGARRAHYTTASLIALERPATDWTGAPPSDQLPQQSSPDPLPSAPSPVADWARRPTLGRTLARAAHAHPHAAPGLQRELEVMGVLSADLLHGRLPHTVRRLLHLGAVCDFAVLLEDLAQWDFDPLDVAGRWRHDFFLTVPDTLLEL
nr:type I-E CRISPR-associated protein Cse2/CasB [Streptomyces regalis]